MDERKQEFNRVRKLIGKVTPAELGAAMREYFVKYNTPNLAMAREKYGDLLDTGLFK